MGPFLPEVYDGRYKPSQGYYPLIPPLDWWPRLWPKPGFGPDEI